MSNYAKALPHSKTLMVAILPILLYLYTSFLWAVHHSSFQPHPPSLPFLRFLDNQRAAFHYQFSSSRNALDKFELKSFMNTWQESLQIKFYKVA